MVATLLDIPSGVLWTIWNGTKDTRKTHKSQRIILKTLNSTLHVNLNNTNTA